MKNGPSPIPDLNWEDIRGAYYDSLDGASEPIKQEAKAAYVTCLKYSVDYQFFDEYSRACEVWLSKNYPAEYHLIDEFKASPNRLGSGLQERPQIVDKDNNPVVEAPPPAATVEKSSAKDEKPADTKPAKAADAKPADTKPADTKPADKPKPNADPLSGAKRK